MSEWKEWMADLKEDVKESMEEWKEMMNDWRHESIKKKPMVPFPPIPRLRPLKPRRSSDRPKVVSSRIGVKELKVINMLIESGLFSTQSEAVDFLVREGIKARKDIIEKVNEALKEIRRIRSKAIEFTQKLKNEIGIREAKAPQSPHKTRICSKCERRLTELPKNILRCPYCGSELEE